MSKQNNIVAAQDLSDGLISEQVKESRALHGSNEMELADDRVIWYN